MVLRVLDPVGEPQEQAQSIAPRVRGLDGLVVGLLVNEKGDATATDFEQDSEIIEARLRAAHGVSDVVRVFKPSAFAPASSAMIEELASRADVVINGLAK